MSSFGQGKVTPELAESIAEAYFLCEQDRSRMGEMLDFGRSVDANYLAHPWVRRAIAARVMQMRRDRLYTREQHILKLQEIRDGALRDDNWKVGLSAEIAVGKAAGLYENIGGDADDDTPGIGSNKPVEQLTSDQIRNRLNKIQSQSLPAPASEMKPAREFPTPDAVEDAFRDSSPF